MWWFYHNWPDNFKLENYGAQGTECFGVSSFIDKNGVVKADFNDAGVLTVDKISIYDYDYRQPWTWFYDNEAVVFKYNWCEGGPIPMQYGNSGDMLYFDVVGESSPLGDVVWIT